MPGSVPGWGVEHGIDRQGGSPSLRNLEAEGDYVKTRCSRKCIFRVTNICGDCSEGRVQGASGQLGRLA